MAQEKVNQIRPNSQVLVLNASYEPLNIVSWKRAVVLLLKEKAALISDKVIKLVEYIKLPLSKVRISRPSRAMIYARDGHKCQYCGATRRLTIDHVIPRCRGGADEWTNLVVACSTCNTRKGSKLLEHTGMKLLREPKAPLNRMFFYLSQSNVPEWREFVFI